MKLSIFALAALFAAIPAAHAGEMLCEDVPRVDAVDEVDLQTEFSDIVALAARWTTATPIPEPCQKPLSAMGALYYATFRYKINFVTERLRLCDADTKLQTRVVDAVNDPQSGLIRVWDQAWKNAVEYEKYLITTHELAGISGEINEPWTTSICWMFVPQLPGVRTKISPDLPSTTMRRPLLLLAEGTGGGGSTGGHGGGDIKMAGYKFKALLTMLDRLPLLTSCGMTDSEFEKAFGGWLSEEIRDPDAWKATEAQILIHALELGKGRTATAAERACLEKPAK